MSGIQENQKSESVQSANQHTGIKKKRISRVKFRELAISVFNRDEYTCQYCNRIYQEDDHALHPHHIIFRSHGGCDEKDNLISLCWDCHRKLHDGFIPKDTSKWL